MSIIQQTRGMFKILDNDDYIKTVFSDIEFIDGEGKVIKLLRGAEEMRSGHDDGTSFRDNKAMVLYFLAGNLLSST